MVIASGRSPKHIYTAAQKLASLLNSQGLTVLGTSISVEGDRDDDWLVVDGGACVFSLFLPDARVEYDLEGLWGPSVDSTGVSAKMWHIDDIDQDDDGNLDDAIVRPSLLPSSLCVSPILLVRDVLLPDTIQDADDLLFDDIRQSS
eukprot:COSAG02_NODE_159_length_32891_cov_17.822518_22_plen_146_part_00